MGRGEERGGVHVKIGVESATADQSLYFPNHSGSATYACTNSGGGGQLIRQLAACLISMSDLRYGKID